MEEGWREGKRREGVTDTSTSGHSIAENLLNTKYVI